MKVIYRLAHGYGRNSWFAGSIPTAAELSKTFQIALPSSKALVTEKVERKTDKEEPASDDPLQDLELAEGPMTETSLIILGRKSSSPSASAAALAAPAAATPESELAAASPATSPAAAAPAKSPNKKE